MLLSRRFTLSGICTVLLVLSVLVADCPAETRSWTGTVGNDWYDGNNWSPTGGPDPSDSLSIFFGSPYNYTNVTTDNGGSITVDGSSSSVSFSYLYVAEFGAAGINVLNDGDVSSTTVYVGYEAGSLGTAIVTGDGSNWSIGNDTIVGHQGTGIIEISDGGRVSSDVTSIGSESGSNGMATVTGEGSRWNTSRDHRIGREGTGTLEISNGGYASSWWSAYVGSYPGSDGTVTVSGAGSKWYIFDRLLVGVQGAGALNIQDGGQVENRDGFIACSSSPGGTVTVTGAGSRWIICDDLYIGQYSSGALDVSYGGSVENDNAWIGYMNGSEGSVAVIGAGATWTNRNELHVGYEGIGTLNIQDGGSVSNTYGWIGYGSGSKGTVAVTGTGSMWTNSSCLYVGFESAGTLNIGDGGSVSNNGDSYVGRYSGSLGVVTVTGDGSTWTNSSPLYLGCFGMGAMIIRDGGSVSNTDCFVGYGDGSYGGVTVADAGSTWTTNTGSLYVGRHGAGAMDILDGGSVSAANGWIGYGVASNSTVTVSGAGSTWTNTGSLNVACYGTGRLNIVHGGLVRVGGTLTIDEDEDGDGFVNMSTGGRLAIYGCADASLSDFLDLVLGTDAINYWDSAISDWSPITNATIGVDYRLDYITDGSDLHGHTVLTVPEPATVSVLLLGAVAMLRRRNE